MITDQSPEKLTKRLQAVKSQLSRIESSGNPNYNWTREWFDLHNEEVEIEEWLQRRSQGADPAPEH